MWKEQQYWPDQPDVARKISEDDPEIKREVKASVIAVSTTDETNAVDRIILHYSSWYCLKKFIAWALRYRLRLLSASRRRKEGELKPLITEKAKPIISVEEMESAEKEVLRYVQQRSFGEELSRLQDRKKKVDEPSEYRRSDASFIKKSSPIYKLDPVQVNSLLCVGGRLRHAPIREESRHPLYCRRNTMLLN